MTHVANVYAEALYGLAKDEGLSEVILEELIVLKDAFSENHDFVRLLSTPNLSKDERCRIVDDSFAGKVQPYILNFIKILTQKGYVRYFGDCCEAYRTLFNEDNGILPVRVVTAIPLTEEQANRLSAKLGKITEKKIELHNVVDEKCLGGVLLDYDGKRVDDTVRHRLDAVHSLLKNTVL